MARVLIGLSVLATVCCSLLIAWWLRDDFDPASVAGKRVVICGASTGIGEELAYRYGALGAKVVLVARREAALQKVVARCTELGAQEARYIVADLSTLEAQTEMVEVSVLATAKLNSCLHPTLE